MGITEAQSTVNMRLEALLFSGLLNISQTPKPFNNSG